MKYLGLVHALVLQATAYLAQLYAYAKESSGPLKPGVDNVEGTVKTVVGPVYQKIEGKPLEILQYVDSKVCMSSSDLNLVVTGRAVQSPVIFCTCRIGLVTIQLHEICHLQYQ